MPQSVLITGCSAGGIGHSLALAFQKRGLMVFATARKLLSMTELGNLPNVHLLTLDVTSETSIASAVETVQAKTGGKLDFLVNNAGQTYYAPGLDTDITVAKEMFETNFWGVLRVTQAFAPLLVAAKGTLITIGSVLGYLHIPYTSIYNSTKAAVHMLAETLRLELAPLGVQVLTVVTGSIATKLHDKRNESFLPPDSYYKSLEDKLQKYAAADDDLVRCDPDGYAEKVVRDVLSGATGRTFRGNNASLVRYGSAWLPMWMLDNDLKKRTGLDTFNG